MLTDPDSPQKQMNIKSWCERILYIMFSLVPCFPFQTPKLAKKLYALFQILLNMQPAVCFNNFKWTLAVYSDLYETVKLLVAQHMIYTSIKYLQTRSECFWQFSWYIDRMIDEYS
jgi:hypothetical protein